MSNAPSVIFTRKTDADVSATYANLPPDTKIVFVSKTSGKQAGAGVAASGGGSITIATANVPAGDYYLRALDPNGKVLASSVEFYIDSASGASSSNL